VVGAETIRLVIVSETVLSIQLLGGFEIHLGEASLAVRSERHRALLARLALAGGAVSRALVLRDVWPDEDERVGRRRLSEALSRLRRSWGSRELLSADGDDLLLGSGVTLEVDALAFEASVKRARAEGDHSAREALLSEAVARYRGELLPGAYAEWCLDRREALEALLREALEGLVNRYRRTGRPQSALESARRLTRLAPLAEGGHRQVMECLALLGRRTEALVWYRDLRARLQAELAIEPEPETVELVRSIRRSRVAPTTMNPGRLPLVGRDRELELLRRGLELAGRGRANAVLLEGPAGLGKSRLVEECAAAARWRGMTALHADAGRTDGRPFGVVVALLESGLTPLTLEPLRAALDAPMRAAAAEVVPALRAAWPDLPTPAPLSPAGARERRIEALRRALDGLAAAAPVAALVDDAHLSDGASLEVLADRNTRAAGGLLLLAWRPSEAGRARRTLTALERGPLERVTLEPLGDGAIVDMVEQGLGQRDAALCRALLEGTGGNPLFLVEWLRHARTCRDPADPAEAPAALGTLVSARLGGLTAPQRATLDAAAVLGGGWRLEALSAVSGLDDPRPHCAALQEAGWLLSDAERMRLSHGLVAEVVYQQIAPAARAALHRRALSWCRARSGAPGAAARHAEALGDPRSAALDAVAAADDALSVGALDDARRSYAQAAAAVVDAEDDDGLRLRVRALSGHTRALGLMGRLAESDPAALTAALARIDDPALARAVRLQQLRSLVEAADTGDARALGEALAADAEAAGDAATDWSARLELARAAKLSGHYAEAVALLERLLESPSSPADRARATFEQAAALNRLGRYRESLETSRRCLELARAERLIEVEVRSLLTIGSIHSEQERYAEAEAAHRAALERARSVGYLYGELGARVNLANLANYQGRYEQAYTEYEAALPLTGFNPQVRCIVLSNAGTVLLTLGRLPESIDAYEQAAAVLPERENLSGLPYIHEGLAGCHYTLKDMDRALAHARLAVDYARRAGDTYILVSALNKVGDIQRGRGALDAARAALEEALAMSREAGLSAKVLHTTVLLAAVRSDQGELDAAVAMMAPIVRDTTDIWVLERWTSLLVVAEHPGARQALLDSREVLIEEIRAFDDPSLQEDFLVNRRTLALDILRALGPLPEDLPLLPWQTRAALPRRGAPTGRALTDAERVTVVWTPGELPEATGSATERRRYRLTRLLDEAGIQDAAPTAADLAAALGVSRRTVVRDIAALRRGGSDVLLRR